MKNILEQFEQMTERFKDKTLFAEVEKSITTTEFKLRCKQVATQIAKFNLFNEPIVVIDNRDINTLISMFAVVYSGNHYVLLDGASPVERLNKICAVIKPKLMLCQEKTQNVANEILKELKNCQTLQIENCAGEIDEKKLASIRAKSTSADCVYILFTSGSTGVPKGTVITHANLLAYLPWFINTFGINENTIFASQTPFYFSASVSDLFSSLFTGATFNIIPKSYFSFPIQLIRFLNERQVNTIYWVPSALCIVANVDLFKYEQPKFLKKVLFAGEVMPNKQLNYWRKFLKDATFANLFGPTELVDICTYYVVNRPFRDDESLPIGSHIDNVSTFIVDERGNEITEQNKVGELYVRGQTVARGYYKNDEQTKKAFVQNPLQNTYPEIVYRTGDLVMLNRFGEYEYCGRADFQIKHKGYRIELGEIERVASAIENVNSVVAVFDAAADKIVLIYTGKVKKEELYSILTTKLPNYMLPELVIKTATMPINANGKIDRKLLSANYKELI